MHTLSDNYDSTSHNLTSCYNRLDQVQNLCNSTNRTSVCQQSLYLRCAWKHGWAPTNYSTNLKWYTDYTIWNVGQVCTPYNKTCLAQSVNYANKWAKTEVNNCTKYMDSKYIDNCVSTPGTCFKAYAEPLCDNMADDPLDCYTRYVQDVTERSSETDIMEEYYKQCGASYILLRAKWAKNDPCLGPNSFDAIENYCLYKDTSLLEKCRDRLHRGTEFCTDPKSVDYSYDSVHYYTRLCRFVAIRESLKCNNSPLYRLRLNNIGVEKCAVSVYLNTYHRCLKENVNAS